MEDKDYLNRSLLITLETLRVDFGVDISDAKGLTGDKLQAWVETAEDAVFEGQMLERRLSMRER